MIGCQGKPLKLIFVGKAWSLPLVGAKPPLLKNIVLGWKWLTLTNTLAYHTPLRLIFVGKAWSLPLVGTKPALLENNVLGWKWLTLINTLAYHTPTLMIGCQGNHFNPSLIFVGKARSLPLVGTKPDLLENNVLGWKWLTLTNTLAYHTVVLMVVCHD